MSNRLPRNVLLASYFENYMMNKLDGGTMKLRSEDLTKNLEKDISTSMNIAKVPMDQRKQKEAEVKKDLDAYAKRMENLLNKIETENFRKIRDNNNNKMDLWSLLRPWIVLFLAELLGTAVLVFLGCGAVIDFYTNPIIPHYLKVLGFGFAVATAVQMFGHISGAHINPAVSIASYVMGLLDYKQFLIYLIAQFIGGILGFGLLKLIVPNKWMPSGFCLTKIDKDTGLIRGFFVEVCFTGILCFFVCTLWDPRNLSKGDSVPIKLAVLITVLCFVSAPLTGASFNTARSFGPALFASSDDWNDHWLYWIAPNLGGAIAGGIYRLIFLPPEPKVPKVVVEEDTA